MQPSKWCKALCALGIALILALPARAKDLANVESAALDQPRINTYISLTPDGQPLSFDGNLNIEAFFDTGASGVLISNNTAAYLGINPSTYNNQTVIYSDVGVVGSDDFHVSDPYYFHLAPYHPNTDTSTALPYTQSFGPIRAQIGPLNATNDPNADLLGLNDLDVLGVPTMAGKVVVMDPKPVNTFLDTMRTYVYNPNTPFDPTHADSNPGIPQTSRHIRLSNADFSAYTLTTPSGAPGPTLASNPFIGPSPTNPSAGDPPGIKIDYNGLSSTGSWLFDTGAAASILSTSQAANLHVRYVAGTQNTDNPLLETYDPAHPQNPGTLISSDDTFSLTIGGIGGQSKLAGFYLDSLLLRDRDADPGNEADDKNLRFLRAPVLVGDITLQNPTTGDTKTLDGVFGMNYLVASAKISESSGDIFPDDLRYGNFDWITYDQPNNILGLEPSAFVPDQLTDIWLGDDFAGNGHWNTADENWLQGFFSIAPYTEGDYVQFADFDTTPYTVAINLDADVAPGSINFANDYTSYVLRSTTGHKITGATGVLMTGAANVSFNMSNDYTGLTDVQKGTLFLNAVQNIGAVKVAFGAVVFSSTSQRFDALVLNGGTATFSPGANKTLLVHDLDINSGGLLEINDNRLIVQANALTRDALTARLIALLKSAHDTDWLGPGIQSTTANALLLQGKPVALGMAWNDDGAGHAVRDTFGAFAADQWAILVRQTWYGDLNLDGKVDSDDVSLFLTGINSPSLPRIWGYGDLNYDKVINADDVSLLIAGYNAYNVNGPLSASQEAALFAAVPEPATAFFLLPAAGFFIRRRRAA